MQSGRSLSIFWLAVLIAATSGVLGAQEQPELPLSPSSGSGLEIAADVVYGHKMGMALTLDVIRPVKQNGAAVVFVVSGGWNSVWFSPETFRRVAMLDELVSRGYVLVILRHSSAPVFKVPDAVADVRQAIRFLHRKCSDYGFAGDRIGVCGMSAGGHLSLMVGTAFRSSKNSGPVEDAAVKRNPDGVAAVVAWFPPTDLREMVGPSRDFPALDFDSEKGDDVSPLLQVTPDDAPTLLIHGSADRLVPLWHSQQIEAAFRKAAVPCELITLEGAGHGFGGADATRATDASVDWFERFLNPPAPTAK